MKEQEQDFRASAASFQRAESTEEKPPGPPDTPGYLTVATYPLPAPHLLLPPRHHKVTCSY